MEKIRETYKDIKDLESLVRTYRTSKIEILKLQDEIDGLKEQKSALSLSKLDKEIHECEDELLLLQKELESNTLLEKDCLSLGDLKRTLETLNEDIACQEKCERFLSRLVTIFAISGSKLRTVFDLRKEEEFFKIVKISKEIEEVFKMTEEKSFYKTIEHKFKSIVASEMQDVVLHDLDVFSTSGSLYLIFPCEESPVDEDFKAKNSKSEEISALYSHFEKTLGCILFVLKNNLARCMLRDAYALEDLVENNRKLENTPFHIKEIEEWALDMAMKEATVINKGSGDYQGTGLYLIEDGLSGKYISVLYFRFLQIHRFIEKSTSKRIEKARKFYRSTALSFFKPEKCKTLIDTFAMYSDVTHFIKKVDVAVEELNQARERLFYEIILQSTVLDLNLNEPILVLKAKIKKIEFDFEENLTNFISSKTQRFFKIQFFEKAYSNFLNSVLQQDRLTANHRQVLCSLCEYLSDLSFEVGAESITNYEKIVSLRTVLESTIEELIDLYEYGRIELDGNELKKLVCATFDDSEERRVLINKIS